MNTKTEFMLEPQPKRPPLEFFTSFVEGDLRYITFDIHGLCSNYDWYLLEECGLAWSNDLHRDLHNHFTEFLRTNYVNYEYPICTKRDYEAYSIPKYAGRLLRLRQELAATYVAYCILNPLPLLSTEEGKNYDQ